MEKLCDQAEQNGIVEIDVPAEVGEGTAYSARQYYVDPIVQRLANMKKFINQSLGIVGTKDEDYALLVSENFHYTLLLSLGIQGSDRAYSDLLTGRLSEIMGVPVVRVPYLDNKDSVSEELKEKDGKWEPIPKDVDLRGTDAILFHKNTFVYKFGPLETRVQQIPTSFTTVFTHRQSYPGKRLPILGKFCVGFKFNTVKKT